MAKVMKRFSVGKIASMRELNSRVSIVIYFFPKCVQNSSTSINFTDAPLGNGCNKISSIHQRIESLFHNDNLIEYAFYWTLYNQVLK